MDYSKLFKLNNKSSHRASSWDQKGGNRDFIFIGSKQTKILADIQGPGIINHIYLTSIFLHPLDFRSAIIKMYWDHEENPAEDISSHGN